MNRRELVAALAGLPGLTLAGRLFAAPMDSPRFLLVFLRGGYDCANVFVPYSSEYYYETRPHIAIQKPDTSTEVGAVALDANWALAPALRDSIAPFYFKRQLSFIPFAGTDDLSRSHFETQDSIELGQATSGRRDFQSGFLGRLATVLADASSIAFTDSLPLVFKGQIEIPNISLKSIGKPAFDQRQATVLGNMYKDHHLYSVVSDGLELRQQIARSMEQEMNEANRGAVSAKGFELEAERMARLMRDQYRIGFIDVAGWDTHVNEGGAEGTLANNLQNLGRGLASFAQSMGSDWNNTVVVVISEFGRTFRENGNNGTDHGHGSVYWVMGGGLNGGSIVGEQVTVQRSTLFQDRDYPVLNDYRAILGGLFARLWSLSSNQLERIFPATTPVDWKLV